MLTRDGRTSKLPHNRGDECSYNYGKQKLLMSWAMRFRNFSAKELQNSENSNQPN